MAEELTIQMRKTPEKGKVPEHLKKYAGQIKEAPKRCKGKKGADYVACLRKEARKILEEEK